MLESNKERREGCIPPGRVLGFRFGGCGVGVLRFGVDGLGVLGFGFWVWSLGFEVSLEWRVGQVCEVAHVSQLCPDRCRANMAHVRQSGPDSGPGFQVHESRRCAWDTYPQSYITKFTSIRRKALTNISVVPSSLGSGCVAQIEVPSDSDAVPL